MKFFVVFAAILALTAALPARSTWTLHEISAALQDPSTSPALIPYLETALNQIMEALYSGQQVEAVAIPLPAEVISPVPAVVPEAVQPTPAAPAAASSPLVQIIVNVNQQSADAVAPSPAVVPEINPTPVVVVDETPVPINPTPVIVVDEVAEPIEPTPVIIVDEVAEEIIVVPPTIEVEPVEVAEPQELNPIDVIAVGAPETNPVDILNPIPVNPAAEAGSIWV